MDLDLKELLRPTQSVELGIMFLDDDKQPSLLRLKTIIETGYDDGFFKIIAPMYQGRIYNVKKGESLSVTFQTKIDLVETAFEINCKVIERYQKNGQYMMTLHQESEANKVQRRSSYRVNIIQNYIATYGEHDEQIEVVTKDISSTGMRVLSPRYFQINSILKIAFDANIKTREQISPELYEENIFDIQCQVIDCFPQNEIRRYMLRLKFMSLSNSQNKKIIKYLNAKQTELIASDPVLSSKRESFDAMFEYADTNRRHGDDPVVKRYQTLSFISLFLFFLSIMFLLYAQPEPVYVLDRFYDVHVAKYWNRNYFIASSVTALITFASSVYGMMLNASRIKRKKDTYNKALLVTTIGSAILLFVLIYLAITKPIFNLLV